MKDLNRFLNEYIYQNIKNKIHKVLFNQIPETEFVNRLKNSVKDEFPGYHIELSKVGETRKLKNCVTMDFMKEFYDSGKYDNASTFLLYKDGSDKNDLCADICGFLLDDSYSYVNKEAEDPNKHQKDYFMACIKTAIEYMKTEKSRYKVRLKSGGSWDMRWVKL